MVRSCRRADRRRRFGRRRRWRLWCGLFVGLIKRQFAYFRRIHRSFSALRRRCANFASVTTRRLCNAARAFVRLVAEIRRPLCSRYFHIKRLSKLVLYNLAINWRSAAHNAARTRRSFVVVAVACGARACIRRRRRRVCRSSAASDLAIRRRERLRAAATRRALAPRAASSAPPTASARRSPPPLAAR